MRSSRFCRNTRTCRAAFLLAALAVWSTVPVRAADPERALSQYLRDRWERSGGFVAGPIYGITQTRDGYLWLATEAGVVRFDGVRFQLFEPLQPTSTTDLAALSVLPDPRGGLWTWLRRAALMRLHDDAFENALTTPAAPGQQFGAMTLGHDDSIIVADSRRGLLVQRAGEVMTVLPRDALPRPFVAAIAQTTDGDIWLGTRHSGLLRVRDGQITAMTEVSGAPITCLIADRHHGLWIGTDSGVLRWDADALTRVTSVDEAGGPRVLAMVQDRDANVWVGTPDGLMRIGAQGDVSIDRRESSSAVTALFEDREGNLWVGDATGLERWRDGVFSSYATVDDIAAGDIGPILSDGDNRLWFAPVSGGLYWLRDGHVGAIASLRNDVIYSITGDTDAILVGRQRGGLTRIRPSGDTFTTETFTERDGLAQNQVFAVHRAREGSVWAGTLSRGATRMKDGVFTTYTTADGLASNTVSAVLDAADGTVWFATPNGASAMSPAGWRRYSTADGLPSNDVNTLFEDATGTLWLGTAAGLAAIHDGQLRTISGGPAILRGSVLGLAADDFAGLWIVTAGHVMRADRDALLDGRIGVDDVREFGAADGLVDTEVIKRHRILTADPRGRVWLATNRGLLMADSRRLAAGGAPALVQVEEILADGSPVTLEQSITIPPGPDRLTFGFAALSLSVPDRVRFRYRLDGFDQAWSAPVSERQAVFTNLGPGAYRFRVVASNSEGAWNSSEAVLSFTIAPAWWQMEVSWAAMALVVASAIWGGYRMRLRQIARQLDVRFEERLAERSRIARELHDTLLQSFQGAVLRFRAVAYMLPDQPVHARETLENAIDHARQAIVEGRDAVQGLRSSPAATSDLSVSIARLAETLLTDDTAQPPPAFHVNVEGTPRDLSPMVYDEVYRIVGEALRNVIRHARASHIAVDIRYDRGNFRLHVRDDGRGIDAPAGGRYSDGHYGMAGMHERAHLVGGTLSIWSAVASGTDVELNIPASVAYTRAGAS